ncbi:hypothetical protein ETAA8_26250 [Anatilimnocola aggregata]|uniref:DUF1501 domain-containing protein n=1 Tax=Anatilimnocola aggregata TaxID=2528021 RepID=A0A517YBC7_9BACT|nr:DUF1501 domain-containing protein [Anatilimnocola aggregata]QDU27537.1 hypothetical protein ETAA8_26250 [Anatilimnocola aggregata]
MSEYRNCAGVSRRDCLQFGLSAMAGVGLTSLLRLQAEASPTVARKGTAKSCVLIWMDGGPTHFETFDPKPDAPAEIRGEFEPISTKLPGVQFSQHMTRLAGMLDQFSVIRSIRHDQGNHGAGNHYMMTGSPPRIPVGCGAFVSFHPSMGSVAAYELGKDNGLPNYFSIPSMSRSGGPNFLGAKYAPFVVGGDPNSADFRVRDVALPQGLTEDHFNRRTDLRKLVDRIERINDPAAGDPVGGLDEYYRQGYDLITSRTAQAAFDIQRESEKVRDAYGRNGFGQRALLARRLVEAGVPFITINDGGWDHHADIFPTLRKRLPDWDNTVATLISDLNDRGLLESTLVVALGEFGRTPAISTLNGQKGAGRDHWANAMSVLIAGGGTPGGVIVGSTDRKGYTAKERVLSPENFVSTIYTKLGIDPGKIVYTPQGRPTHLVSDATTIRELA